VTTSDLGAFACHVIGGERGRISSDTP